MLMDKIDFHVHSNYSPCASGDFTILKIFQTADELGLRYIMLTDHWTVDTDPNIFIRERKEVNSLQKDFRVKVILSAEIDVLNSEGKLAADLAEAREILDVISVAPHHYFSDRVEKPSDLSQIPEYGMEMLISLTKNKDIKVILHPDIAYFDVGALKVMGLKDVFPIPQNYYREFMKAAKEAGKVLQLIGCFHNWVKLEALARGWSEEIVSAVLKKHDIFMEEVVKSGVKFVIGTDCHNEYFMIGGKIIAGEQWFGRTAEAVKTLKQKGINENNLWIPKTES